MEPTIEDYEDLLDLADELCDELEALRGASPQSAGDGAKPPSARATAAAADDEFHITRNQLRDHAFMTRLQRKLDASPDARARFRILD